jgi:hydroxymethylglutaryl-CoA synthase
VKLLKNNHIDEPKQKEKLQNFQNSLIYSRRIGNCYTASLYISLISLLDHAENLSEQKIGFYSYGSGSTAEFFCGTVQPGYKQACFSQYHTTMIEQRSEITMEDYEYFYNFEHPTDGQCFPVPEHPVGSYRLTALEEHKRIYSPQPSDA